VQLGGMAEGLRVVTSGLKAGEKIVIGGTQRVMMPNQQITPKLIGMDGKEEEKPSEAKPEESKPAEDKQP
jgi:multidrug efflux system membrane fusion protein